VAKAREEVLDMAMMAATRLATRPVYAVIQAADLERAKRFYGETLGLEIESAPDTGGFMVHAGDGTMMLVYHSEMTQPCEYTVAMWGVDDIQATVTELRDHGVRFEEYDLPGLKTMDGVAEYAGGWGAWFKDSEDNIINIMQRK
jgi:predicted enzyme related to lactoylglutathione lyase